MNAAFIPLERMNGAFIHNGGGGNGGSSGSLDLLMGVGLAVVVGVLLAATAYGLWHRTSSGRLRAVKGSAAAPASTSVFDEDELGPLGERATLVQFSSAFCAPCRATRRVLDEVATRVQGVRHVEIDAESHLELVRRLDVRRTPTVFVLDATGAVVRRAVGQPRTPDVVAALGEAVR
jgi:thiol-disulfide isomerase/thioredoxin